MKSKIQLILFISSVLLLAGCGATSTVTDSSGGRDGSSFEKAVIASSVRAEYKWIDRTYPGAQLLTQIVVYRGDKPFDKISLKTKEGEERDIYFDISGFYKPKQYNVEGQQVK